MAKLTLTKIDTGETVASNTIQGNKLTLTKNTQAATPTTSTPTVTQTAKPATQQTSTLPDLNTYTTGFEEPTTKEAVTDAKKFATGLGGAILGGADIAATGISSTANWLLGRPLQALGWQNNPISALDTRLKSDQQANAQNLANALEAQGTSEAGKKAVDLGKNVVAALPQAVIAYMTAGLSTAAQGTSAGLQAASASAASTGGLANTIKTGIQTMLKSPNYWTAFAQTAGTNYDQAKADGATDAKATAFATVNGLLNALVEVGGGGIQELPTALKSGNASAIRQWVDTMLDEGKEEVVQGVIERLAQNVTYNKGNPLASVTNPNAVFNPVTSAKEGAMGSLVGGILGGGQIMASKALTPKARVNTPTAQTTAETAPQTQTAPVMPQTQNPVQAPTIAQGATQAKPVTYTENVAESGTAQQGKARAQSFDERKAAFNDRAQKYNDLLQGIHGRGSATDEEYRTLETEGAALNAESASLEQEQRVQSGQVSRNFESPENHIDNRTNENVKNPSVKAFQFDHPQLHKHFVEAAQQLQAEAAKAQESEGFGTSKNAKQNSFFHAKYSGPVRDAINLGLSKNEVMKCCEDIINNNGQENYAAAKRVELILDAMLSDGYTGMSSDTVNKNDAYIAEKEKIAGAEKESDRRARQDAEVDDFLVATEGAQPQSNGIFPQGSLGAKIAGELPSGVGAMSNPFPTARKVSDVYTNTLKNTDLLNDVQKAQLDERDYTFDSVGEKQSVAVAQQRLEADFDGEVADLSAKPAYTAAEDVDTAMGILGAFAKDGESKGDFTAMKQWSKDLYSKIHQSAVTLQAMDKYSRTPEGAVIKAQQVISGAEQKLTTKKENGKTVKTAIGRKITSDVDNVTKIVNALVNGEPTTGMAKDLYKVRLKDIKELVASGTYDADAINELVRSKFGIPTLTTADIQKVYELNKLAQETTNDYQKRVFINRAARLIADKLPVKAGSKILAGRRIAMLLNPKTLISRNAGGNIIFGLLEDIKDATGTLVDILVSTKTGRRTTSYNPIATSKAEFLGAKKGLTEWVKDIKNGVDTSPTQHEMPRSTALKSKFGAGAETVLYKLLALGDRPFFEAAYSKRIDELKRLGLDYTSDDAVAEATTYALERVFQNNSVLAQKAMELRESLGVLGDIAIPFAQTPANIIDKVLDYSPYGIKRAIQKAGTIKDSAWSQKQFVDTLARSLTGTGIIALGAVGFLAGFITGGEDDNEDEALTYQKKISGWQPYSINFGDKSYTYDWANPVGTLLALGADIAQSGSLKDTLSAILMAGLKAGINTMFNQSYLEGLSEIFGQDDVASGLETMLINLPASFTPTAFQQIARLIDPIARDTYDTDPFKRAWNKVIAKIPWASKSLPAKIGASGKEITNFGGGTTSNILESLLSPGYIGETTTTKVDNEVQRLYEATGETSVFPEWSEYTSKSDFSLNANGEKYTMTAAEWETYQKTRGTTAYQLISSVLNTAAYRNLSNAEKANLISDINSYANDTAKRNILKARGETYSSSWDAEAAVSRESGIPVTTYLIYENAVSGLTADKDEDGNSISGSKKNKVVDYIASLNLTDKQKDYLYLSEGYAESTLSDAPWHSD